MNYPQFKDKYQYAALTSAQKSFEYNQRRGRVPDGPHPRKVILCYQDSFFQRVTTTHKGRWSTGTFRKLYWLNDHTAIALFGVGAPYVVLKTEMLIAWGVKEFISIGTAGAIAPHLKVGDLVGCDRAIRDEGTSHHYLPLGRYSHPTDHGAFARKFPHIGTTWTLDAFFRHTREEILHYQKEGVLTVDMEASALFAMAEVRKVSLSAAFVISDLLHGEDWEREIYQPPIEDGLDTLLNLALN